MRWSWVLMFAFERGCFVSPSPTAPETVIVRPLTHLPGTLLRDAEDRYWVVGHWPDREPVTDAMLPLVHTDLHEAILLTAEEARCLRPSTRAWFARFLWRLVRVPSGEFWYVNESQRYRRSARRAVIAAWRDRIEMASISSEGVDAFEAHYRDLGPMPPPDSSIFLVGDDAFAYTEGRVHRFENRALAHQVGYTLATAIPVSMDELVGLGERGEELTITTFQVCPLAAANLRSEEDHDGDGVPFFQDCDDDDARRHPGHAEVCDGIDNDCDLVVDNGFDVGFRCLMEDACRTPAYTRCADHRLGTVCWDDEAVCTE